MIYEVVIGKKYKVSDRENLIKETNNLYGISDRDASVILNNKFFIFTKFGNIEGYDKSIYFYCLGMNGKNDYLSGITGFKCWSGTLDILKNISAFVDYEQEIFEV